MLIFERLNKWNKGYFGQKLTEYGIFRPPFPYWGLKKRYQHPPHVAHPGIWLIYLLREVGSQHQWLLLRWGIWNHVGGTVGNFNKLPWNHGETWLQNIKGQSHSFVTLWIKKKSLQRLCAVFEDPPPPQTHSHPSSKNIIIMSPPNLKWRKPCNNELLLSNLSSLDFA